ncbi:DUF3288 family protein [Spirulina subsalsa]|uniref:DUF3288 family protein n=1 Tax=Spirulina subsalsa TaxID=54311 RepID=UPI00031603DA|nr:DUF3288 family protein [Spirulina subsalsa]
MTQGLDQQHPQENRDRAILETIAQEGRSDYNLVELARLCIRYENFPGARQIQRDLQDILAQWNLTVEELFTLTRAIHQQGQIYRRTKSGEDIQDWS